MENNGKAKRDFYMMMRWAIRTMFQNNPNAIVSVRELEKQLDDAWFDLIDEGYVTTCNNDN